MRERSPRPRATPRGDNSAPTTGPEARRAEAQEQPTTSAPRSGACPDGAPAVGRKPQPPGRRLSARRQGGTDAAAPSASFADQIPTCAFWCILRLLRLLCLLWINFQRYRLGRTLLHAFRNDYRKKHKKQPRHPKEITPIKSYQKYAYFAFPHAHVPYIIGEPPQNLV